MKKIYLFPALHSALPIFLLQTLCTTYTFFFLLMHILRCSKKGKSIPLSHPHFFLQTFSQYICFCIFFTDEVETKEKFTQFPAISFFLQIFFLTIHTVFFFFFTDAHIEVKLKKKMKR